MPSSKAIAQIRSDEGTRERAYFDKLDIKTIGIGFNLERSDAKEQLILAGVSSDDIDEIMSGKKVLNSNQIDALFNNSLLEAEAVADGFIGGSEVPQVVKDAIVNMSFQLGPTRLRLFELMKAALDEGDWKGVQREMADSKWAKTQTPKRAKRLIKSISGLKQPAPTVPEKPIDPKTAMKEEQRARDIESMAISLARVNQIEGMAQALADAEAAKDIEEKAKARRVEELRLEQEEEENARPILSDLESTSRTSTVSTFEKTANIAKRDEVSSTVRVNIAPTKQSNLSSTRATKQI